LLCQQHVLHSAAPCIARERGHQVEEHVVGAPPLPNSVASLSKLGALGELACSTAPKEVTHSTHCLIVLFLYLAGAMTTRIRSRRRARQYTESDLTVLSVSGMSKLESALAATSGAERGLV
jgi:hypothetical protein